MKKLTSRKLWAAIVGVTTGIFLIASGNVTEGTATIITSVVGYLAAEGLIDAMAVKSVAGEVEKQLEESEGE